MKKMMVIMSMVIILSMIMCKPITVTQPTLFPPMSKSQAVSLVWTNMPDAPNVKGVNIYMGKDDSWKDEPGTSEVLKQYLVNDTPITDTTYEITGLENGEEYYVQLRVVLGNDPTDEGTEVKRFYPRPEGQVYIYAIGEGDNTGLYWNENGEAVVVNAEENPELVDVCLVKDTTGKYYFVSPSELYENGKTTGFAVLGTETDGWEWYRLIDAPEQGYENRIEVGPNTIVSVHTQEDHYAKLRFEGSETQGGTSLSPSAAISLTWAFQTRRGFNHY